MFTYNEHLNDKVKEIQKQKYVPGQMLACRIGTDPQRGLWTITLEFKYPKTSILEFKYPKKVIVIDR